MNMKRALILLGLAVASIMAVLFLLPSIDPAADPKTATEPEKKAQASRSSHEGAHDDFSSLEVGSARSPATPLSGGNQEPWEERLDALLTTETNSAATVRGLTLNFASLPPEAQEEFIAHAVNLCEDEQYSLLEGIYLNNATPAEVKDTIFNDLLNRPDEIKLPLLAKSLANPAHPMTDDSREILEMYLEVEAGSVPPEGWEAAVKKYLATQSASEPAH